MTRRTNFYIAQLFSCYCFFRAANKYCKVASIYTYKYYHLEDQIFLKGHSKELGKEQSEAEAEDSKASKRHKTVSDDEIGSFLKQERNRPVEREPTNRRENAETTPEEPNNRALWFDEDEDLTKNNAMYNVASPELVTREYGAESVDETSDAEGRISPLPNDYYAREPVEAVKQEAMEDEAVQSDGKQSDEGGQEAADQTPPRRVVLEETI